MNFDLRFPIGMMFTIYGVLMTGYGAFGKGTNEHTDININLIWGIVLLIFGGAMWFAAYNSAKKQPKPEDKDRK